MRDLDQADTLSARDRAILLEAKQRIQGFLPTALIYVYGSVARGTNDQESDYDILVLTDEVLAAKQEDEIDDAVYDIQLKYCVVISTVFYSKSQWELPLFRGMPFRYEVEKDGILL